MASPFASSLALVAPLWDLEQFVAVNPFVGQTDRPFAEVLADLPGETPSGTSVPWKPDSAEAVLGPFLASYFSPESTLLAPPWGDLPLWQAWKASLPGSASLGRKERRSLAALVRGLPDTPGAAWAALAPAGGDRTAVVRLLGLVPGWAGALRRKEWPGEPTDDGPLAALAAMVAALEAVVPDLAPASPPRAAGVSALLANLEARETDLRNQVRSVLARKDAGGRTEGPLVRAAFCIDVRSEPFRRAWEAADPRVDTDGFAGFFGLPLGWTDGVHSRAHLPVLLTPRAVLAAPARRYRSRPVLGSAGTPNFPLVEVAGWAAGWKLLARPRPRAGGPVAGVEGALGTVPLGERVAWARSLVTNFGWAGRWAPVMAFVGHGSTSVNNPHAAGLDCGACGGRTGEVSARAAAALLNDPTVRTGLAEAGVVIPGETWFVGALHDTTLDTLAWYDQDLPDPVRATLASLKPGLVAAGTSVRAGKALRFPFLRGAAGARDEAEVRPDPALAGNAVFVAAPRALTRGADLGGRAFLHSYDPDRDPEGTVLELILTAPVVVASWINLQYLASTLWPRLHGAGDKVLHSRVGTLGVFEGNSWDLKAGLPRQSVFWGTRPYHEPVRLQVVVTAPVDRVQGILVRHPEVVRLFDRGWVGLSVADGAGTWLRRVDGRWEREEPSA